MRLVRLNPFGVELTDLAVAALHDRDAATFRGLLAEHGVVVIRRQHLDDEGFEGFLRRFGDLTFTPGETPLPGFPDLNVVTNVGRSSPPRSVFHVDTSYVARPPAYTALRAVEVPEHGGQTLFTNQYLAYETLPIYLKLALRGRTITHAVSGAQPGSGDERVAEHPAVQAHPVTGRLALYLSTPERCLAISGLAESEGTEMIASLYAHSTQADQVLRHTWASGDLVMWDNRCVMHRADHADVIGDRVLHRGMVVAAGGRPR